MGIHDRHYVRDQPSRGAGRGGVGGMRMWSINTWLIAICVAVFVIDGFLPMRLVGMGPPYLHSAVPSLPESWAVEGDASVQDVPIQEGATEYKRQMLVRPVVDQPGGAQIGWMEVKPMRPIAAAMYFSTYKGFFRFEFWRFVGFQFLHGNFGHILFNMIGLYFFGPMVEQYLGRKRYLAFYLLAGICGALMYLLLNVAGYIATLLGFGPIPGLLFYSTATPLLGASAGVFGVLMAGAFLAPRSTVLLFFILPMQLRTLAYALVAVATFTVLFGGDNAGGEAGHLGGAIAGFYFIRHPKHLHGFFDILGRVDPTSHHYRDRKMLKRPGRPSADGVDRILDKVNSQGLQSLTAREKKILREASRD